MNDGAVCAIKEAELRNDVSEQHDFCANCERHVLCQTALLFVLSLTRAELSFPPSAYLG